MFCNTVRLTKKQRAVVSALPKELTDEEKHVLGALLGGMPSLRKENFGASREP